jgi:chromosome segregation ATPase
MKYLSVILHGITLVALGVSSYFWIQSSKILKEKKVDLQSIEQEKNELQEDLETQTSTNEILRENLVQKERSEDAVAINLNEVNSQLANAIKKVGEKSQAVEKLQRNIDTLEGKHRRLEEDHSKFLDSEQSEQTILHGQFKKKQDALALRNRVLEARNQELEKQVQGLEIDVARIKYLSKFPPKVGEQKQLKTNGDHRPNGGNPSRSKSISLRK